MSMTEAPAAPAAPARKRKPARRKRSAAAPKPASGFAGLTVNECCSACSADGCVISGRSYCGHPYKGGLQGRDLANDPALERLNAAKKMLGKAKIKLDKI